MPRDLQTAALEIFHEALRAADAAELVRRALHLHGGILQVGDLSIDLDRLRRVLVVGAGKASGAMAQGVESVLAGRIAGGLVVVKDGYVKPTQTIRQVEASHPVPDQRGLEAARAILALLENTGPDDLVLCLISGGGSALIPLPVQEVSLAEKQGLTRLLLRAGATITELNTVRKHLSQIKGGQLARRAQPASMVTLLLSDVIGDPLDVIASGPTAPDPTTFTEALEILEKYNLAGEVSPAIRSYLTAGAWGKIPETPKPEEPLFGRVHHRVVGNNRLVVGKAVEAARDRGFTPLLLTRSLQGEAREVAKVYVAIAKELREGRHPVPTPACVIAGGETTVTVRGDGLGGRCQEFALAAAIELSGVEGVVILAAGTDGTDGPTDAAGALADGLTLSEGEAKGLSARDHLSRNDSYPFFSATGGLVVTGPTATNLLDLYLLLADRP